MSFAPFLAWTLPDLSGSAVMRYGFLALCLLILLLSAWDGRREGLGRKTFGIIALIGGVVAGYFGADFWGSLVGTVLDYPVFALRLIGGFIGFLIVSLGFSLIGMFVFRPTRKVKDPELKRIVGIGGTIAGVVLGLLTILLLMLIVRITGRFGENFISSYGPTLQAQTTAESETSVDLPAQTQLALDALAWTVRLNASINQLPAQKAVAAIDPIPDKTYRVTGKAMQVLADPALMQRFAEQPQTRQILDEPVVQELLQDEQIVALAEAQDLNGLMSHPRVLAITQDARLSDLLEKYELEAALDNTLSANPAAQSQAGNTAPSAQPPIIIVEPVESPSAP